MNNSNKNLNFASLTPKTIENALGLMASGYKPIAGGTDEMVRRHAIKKSHEIKTDLPPIFSCKKISGTNFISLNDERFSIGSSVSLSGIIDNHHCPSVLRDSLLSIASPGIRNIASLAGNICNASPAADSLPALYILNAEIESAALSENGSVNMTSTAIADFIQGPGKTIAGNSALVTGISCEHMENYTQIFRKVGTRAANALSKLSVAALYKIDDGVFTDFRLAVGACAPIIIRSIEAEQLVRGCSQDEVEAGISDIIEIYSDLLKPIDDQRSTAVYRKNTALKLIRNIILNAEINYDFIKKLFLCF